MTYLCVGLGCALGAMLRYALSLVTVKLDFPLMTFLTNLLGALIIGFLAGLAENGRGLSSHGSLFLKTGFCGGFTTFSTFSLETVTLLEQRHYALGILYAAASLLLCLLGVCAGQLAAKAAVGK